MKFCVETNYSPSIIRSKLYYQRMEIAYSELMRRQRSSGLQPSDGKSIAPLLSYSSLSRALQRAEKSVRRAYRRLCFSLQPANRVQ
jgi:hypothetical protein